MRTLPRTAAHRAATSGSPSPVSDAAAKSGSGKSRSRFARCWFDRTFHPRDFALALALGLAALGTSPAFADGGDGGQGTTGEPGAGGTLESPQGGDGTGNSGGGGGGPGGGLGGAGGPDGGAVGGNGGEHGFVGPTLPAGDLTGLNGADGQDGNTTSIGGGNGGGGGGAGGFGAVVTGTAGASVATGQTIRGGDGGAGGTPGAFGELGELGGNGGDGGIGLSIGSDLTNAGTIAGGDGGSNLRFFTNSPGGRGGDGVSMSGGNLINDAAGSITGGDGGSGNDSGDGGDGGDGVSVTDGDITNAGTIAGGFGGGGSGFSLESTGGTGGSGATLSGGTLTNDGTIVGGDGFTGFESSGISGNGGAGAVVTGGDVVNNATGTIAGGHGDFSTFTGTAGGSGGIGLSLTDGNLTNAGTIIGGGSGDGDFGDGGNGGAGAVVSGGNVNNTGTIEGGFGDFGGNGSGGVGGNGLSHSGGDLTNAGSITGGSGGDGTTQGGAGGLGVVFNGTQMHNAAGATITGGNGGAAGGTVDTTGGAGGIGVMLQENSLVNDGTIVGGNAGDGFFAGAGGNGVAADRSTVVNNAGGTIIGGNGGLGAGMSGSVNGLAGPGVTLSSSTLINHGTITGGNEAFPGGSGIGAGVLAGNSTIITDGTISGGTFAGTPGAISNAVTFGVGTNRLELHAGAVFNGNVAALLGTDDTFTLGGTTSSSFDAGTIGDDRQFRGFETYQKTGTSTWSLTGTPGRVTPWTIFEGTLAVNGGLTGTVDVQSAGTLGGVGTITGDVTNAGVVSPGNSIGTLLIDGNYAGNGGRLDIETILGDDGFPADRLLISGDVTGTTPVLITNQGGTGAATGTTNTDGSSIIQVGGNSSADAFTLAGGYAAVGPYRYDLNAFAPGSSAAGQLDPRLAATGTTSYWDYRLQSASDANGAPIPVPQVPLYEALAPAALQYGWALTDNLHDRLGEIQHVTDVRAAAGSDNCVVGAGDGEGYESFFRAQGWNGQFDGDRGPDFDQDLWFLQTGANIVGFDLRDNGDSMRLGMAFSYGRSQIAAPDPLGVETGLDFESPSLALTGTYQAADGWYVDTVLRGSYYNVDAATSARGQVAEFDGAGFGASVETGYPVLLAERLIFEPQLQVGYLRNWFNDFTDVDGLAVDFHDNNGLRGRLGGRLQKTFVSGRDADRLWSPYLTADVLQGFLNDGSLTASGVNFATDTSSTSLMFGTGLNAQLGERWGLYTSAAYLHGLSDGGIDHAWTGNGGLRWNF